MDLNYLYKRHQISIFMAEHATGAPARAAHQELAERYAAEIARTRFAMPKLRAVA